MYYKTSEQEKIELGFGGHQCNNGMHFCGFYENAKERDDIILGFFNQGIKDNDVNLYCPVERTKEDFKEQIAERYTISPAKVESSISFSTVQELYYPRGEFSPWEMDKSLEAFYTESQKNGENNVRASAEMVWALDLDLDKTKLMAYESRLNYFIPGKHWITICLYNLSRFSGSTIMQVLQTHPWIISKGGQITKNSLFVDPDTWLRENAPEYLDENKK